MKILEHVPLASYTTFKIGGPARFFCVCANELDLVEAVIYAKSKDLPIFVLGGGSNILISDEGFTGMVIKMEIKGIEYQGANPDGTVCVSAAAGETWDDLVNDTVGRGLYGLENLSAIPGSVGATPVQNIGAYGREASEVIESVRVLDTHTLQLFDLSNSECHFSYRDSVFKHVKGRYVITRVDFNLSPIGKPDIEYKELKNYFAPKFSDPAFTGPTLKEVRQAVIDVRWGKLPDWKLWGTAGSFFKNPMISTEHFSDLKQKYPEIMGFPEANGLIKVSLAWILDKVCNVKGLCVGNVCTYDKQALVVVTKPGAAASEVVELTHELMRRTKEKTGIEIEAEVEWVN